MKKVPTTETVYLEVARLEEFLVIMIEIHGNRSEKTGMQKRADIRLIRSSFGTLMAFLALFMAFSMPAVGHPFAVLSADVVVHEDHLEMNLVATVEEFYYAFELPTNEYGDLISDDLRPIAKKYKEKIREELIITDVDGNRLEPDIYDMVPKSAASWEKLPESMEGEVLYKIRYPLALPPASLFFSHTFGGEKSLFPSVLKLDLTQVGWPRQERRLVGKTIVAEVNFDWLTEPPAGDSRSASELEKEETERLGIVSYGSIYAFLYVEPHEVRFEILAPLATVETWVPVKRKKPSVLEVEEQEAAKEDIFQFFARTNPVLIDGAEVLPVLSTLDFFDLDIRDFALRSEPRPVPLHIARMGLILRYPTRGIPDSLQITWELFSESVRDVRTTLFAQRETKQIILRPNEPVLSWTNTRKEPLPEIIPVSAPPLSVLSFPALGFSFLVLFSALVIGMFVSGVCNRTRVLSALVLLGLGVLSWPFARIEMSTPFSPSSSVSGEEARSVFSSLLTNVYRSFEYSEESDIYDSLDKSVGGELLADLYLKVRDGLEMQEQGGAVSRVREVLLEDGEILPKPEELTDDRAFGWRGTWTVEGTVEHWGHVHTRINRYSAEASVRPHDDGAWRIAGFLVTDQERVKFQTRIRKMD